MILPVTHMTVTPALVLSESRSADIRLCRNWKLASDLMLVLLDKNYCRCVRA